MTTSPEHITWLKERAKGGGGCFLVQVKWWRLRRVGDDSTICHPHHFTSPYLLTVSKPHHPHPPPTHTHTQTFSPTILKQFLSKKMFSPFLRAGNTSLAQRLHPLPLGLQLTYATGAHFPPHAA